MPKRNGFEIRAYGLRVLLSRHGTIRRMKAFHNPSEHGNRCWSASWLLMDYLKAIGLPDRSRVMEVGCGWGLTGIYAAKKLGASVIGVDADPAVFPYLRLHAHLNKVKIETLMKPFDSLRGVHLEGIDIVIGSDICFWETLARSLRKLILRAMRAGVQSIFISDPGRHPFNELADEFVRRKRGEVMDWAVHKPRPIRGRILKIENSSAPRSGRLPPAGRK